MELETSNDVEDRQAFARYLRTGRIDVPRLGGIEVKFNPYHDPRTGRFTFGPGGGGGFATATGSGGRGRAGQRQSVRYPAEDPRNPTNHDVYAVREGDTLGKIAARRKGVRPAELAELNGLDLAKPLRIGQQLKLPKQSYLDAGRNAKNTAVALDFYIQSHGGKLPPDVRHPPSLEQQILGPQTWHAEHRNGYTYQLDPISRPRSIDGAVGYNPDQRRSKTAQAMAGGKDRLPTDHGSHYIARQFNGPTDAFNHFAQDAHFNNGAYRQVEGRIAVLRRTSKVHIQITPHYPDFSLRPDVIEVHYEGGGKSERVTFLNRKGGK